MPTLPKSIQCRILSVRNNFFSQYTESICEYSFTAISLQVYLKIFHDLVFIKILLKSDRNFAFFFILNAKLDNFHRCSTSLYFPIQLIPSYNNI